MLKITMEIKGMTKDEVDETRVLGLDLIMGILLQINPLGTNSIGLSKMLDKPASNVPRLASSGNAHQNKNMGNGILVGKKHTIF